MDTLERIVIRRTMRAEAKQVAESRQLVADVSVDQEADDDDERDRLGTLRERRRGPDRTPEPEHEHHAGEQGQGEGDAGETDLEREAGHGGERTERRDVSFSKSTPLVRSALVTRLAGPTLAL